jgi:hypothetical protein
MLAKGRAERDSLRLGFVQFEGSQGPERLEAQSSFFLLDELHGVTTSVVE